MKKLTLLLLTVAVTSGCGSLMPSDMKFKITSSSEELKGSQRTYSNFYDPFQITR